MSPQLIGWMVGAAVIAIFFIGRWVLAIREELSNLHADLDEHLGISERRKAKLEAELERRRS